MSKSFRFVCDFCHRGELAFYNGEHYLPPKGWKQFYDPNFAKVEEQHLCLACIPKPKTTQKTKSK